MPSRRCPPGCGCYRCWIERHARDEDWSEWCTYVIGPAVGFLLLIAGLIWIATGHCLNCG